MPFISQSKRRKKGCPQGRRGGGELADVGLAGAGGDLGELVFGLVPSTRGSDCSDRAREGDRAAVADRFEWRGRERVERCRGGSSSRSKGEENSTSEGALPTSVFEVGDRVDVPGGFFAGQLTTSSRRPIGVGGRGRRFGRRRFGRGRFRDGWFGDRRLRRPEVRSSAARVGAGGRRLGGGARRLFGGRSTCPPPTRSPDHRASPGFVPEPPFRPPPRRRRCA